MLPACAIASSLQGTSGLLRCSVAALSLLGGGQLPWSASRALHNNNVNSSSDSQAALNLFRQLHHAAAVDPAGSSDEDNTSSSSNRHSVSSTTSRQQPGGSRGGTSWAATSDPQRPHNQGHQQQHVGQLHHLAGPHSQQLQASAAQPQQQARYEGHLHAPHGRRHMGGSRSQVDRFISEQLLSCKSLGMLRRIQIKHKATMEPEHVADTLLCLQHLVRAARHARQTGARTPGFPYMHHATSQARSQPRVRAAGELSRSKGRASESDGHMEQLMGQMLGELGSSIWFMMGDMTGPDLAKVLYSWAALDWHPEPELLADVKASFISAAAGGGLQQPQQTSQQQELGQQQAVELDMWQGPWMAAGLWGLLKLGEPCEGRVLQLLQQHWQQLVHHWTPQQVSDIAHALALTADEQMAAALTAGGDEAEQQGLQLMEVVLGLSRHMLAVLAQQQQGDGEGAGLLVPLPWPDSMLVQLQASLMQANLPAAQRAAAAVNEIAAAGPGGSPAAGAGDAPMMAVHNMPQLAWRMLQALAAVGVNVSEPEDQAVGIIVAALSEATKVPVGGVRML